MGLPPPATGTSVHSIQTISRTGKTARTQMGIIFLKSGTKKIPKSDKKYIKLFLFRNNCVTLICNLKNGKLRESGRRKVIGLPGASPMTAGLPGIAPGPPQARMGAYRQVHESDQYRFGTGCAYLRSPVSATTLKQDLQRETLPLPIFANGPYVCR